MYYLVYGFLYLVSLLPLSILYLAADFAYFIIYYVLKYRKDLVQSNLLQAFPEKTDEERTRIAKQFFKNFCDTFIESIKLISMPTHEIDKRSKCDIDYLNELIDRGLNVHVMAGHQFNWEFANLVYARNISTPFYGVYAPIGNKIFDRIFYNMRARYGTKLVSAKGFSSRINEIFSGQYVLALAADQNTNKRKAAYWIPFFGKPVPFVSGPGKGAVKNNTAVIFIQFKKIKRGYYSFIAHPITEDGSLHSPEELTIMYKRLVEDAIRKDPPNYLWSHRRWKNEWKPEYPPVLED